MKELLETKTPRNIRSDRAHLGVPHHVDVLQLSLPLGNVGPLLVGRNGVDSLRLPTLHSLVGLRDLAPDDLVFLAHLALGSDTGSFEDELHTAGLAGSVLFVAVGTEASPLVVATGEDLLIVETHGWIEFQGGVVD